MSQAIGVEAGQEDETPTGIDHNLNHMQERRGVLLLSQERALQDQCKELKEHLEKKKNGKKPLESAVLLKKHQMTVKLVLIYFQFHQVTMFYWNLGF